MYKINYLRSFILIFLTNTLLVIGISSPEASDGEEEMDGFRTVTTSRRRLKSNPEPITTYLPEVIASSPNKRIRECQDRARFFATSQNLKTFDDIEVFIEDVGAYHASDLINLANHYRHIPSQETTSLAATIFNNIISSKSRFITNRHKSLSYLGLAKIQGRAEDYEEAINLATKADKYESTKEIIGFLQMMAEKSLKRSFKSLDVRMRAPFTLPQIKPKRAG
ncbi:MAG: hypothetical protein K2W94_04385 [Alphaproteobacteria bacterium]|nr:hypothetical protein [Alphaproteobacteria bacterium]